MKFREYLKEEKEFVIWGIPPNKKDEEILYTKAKTLNDAKKVIKVLETKHNCTKCRIQTIDLSKELDLKKEFGKTIN